MNINGVGLTAFVIAYFRDLERHRRHPLFEDIYSQWFLFEEIKEKAQKMHEILPEAGDMIRYRICFFNDITRRGIDDGIRQIVLLGAGFDMRSMIFRTEGVNFYDVDQPAVLEYKHDVLKKHGIPACAAIPCNYLEANLTERLAEAGFDPGEPALLLWEGNTMYLPLARIYDFLGQLHRQIDSFRIAFDYFSSKIIDRTSGIEGVTRVTDFFEHNLGAPWVTGFDDLRELERNTGLGTVESGFIEDVGKDYAPEDAVNITKLVNLYRYAVLAKTGAVEVKTAA